MLIPKNGSLNGSLRHLCFSDLASRQVIVGCEESSRPYLILERSLRDVSRTQSVTNATRSIAHLSRDANGVRTRIPATLYSNVYFRFVMSGSECKTLEKGRGGKKLQKKTRFHA